MNKPIRVVLVLLGASFLVLSLGFFFQAAWAAPFWPLPSGRLSNYFVSSILAAIGVPIIWIGLADERRSMAGGALNLLVTSAGFSVSLLTFYGQARQQTLLVFGLLSALAAIACIGLILYSQRKPFVNTHPLPGLIRASFLGFAVVLLATAIALLIQHPNTFPWPLSGGNSILYGWIFLGAMCYFLYATLYPVWSNARGQLLGFLAYDLILIGPFISYFRMVPPAMRSSLIIYTAVVTYSGLLAIYFLFVHPGTRFSLTRKS